MNLLNNKTVMGVKRITKALLAYTAYSSGLLEPLTSYRTGITIPHRIIILGYHRVVKDFSASSRWAIPSLLISAHTFKQHLKLIQQNFDCMSLDKALAVIAGQRGLTRDAVVLTFDDGYQDFYDVAFPILRAYRMPATIFVPTALIGQQIPLLHDQLYYLLMEMSQGQHSLLTLLTEFHLDELLPLVQALDSQKANHYSMMRALVALPQEKLNQLLAAMKQKTKFVDTNFPTEYQLLNWPQLLELAAAGITIGAHTRKHTLLTQESTDIVVQEIYGSKAELEQNLGQPVDHFSYPDGRYNSQIAAHVRNADFLSACTIEDRPNTPSDSPYQLKRKLLWERSCLGIFSNFSEIVAECQLRGLFADPTYKWQAS